MNDPSLRAAHLLVMALLVACGGPSATDFREPDPGASSGGTGAPSGGSGGTGVPSAGSGGAGAPSAGSGGVEQGGAGGVQPGGSAGVQLAGAAGIFGVAGVAGTGSGTAGTGSGTVLFPCGGGLMCVEGRQYCRREPTSTGEHFMCSPFVDSCITLDCSCFCNPPQGSPCGSVDACSCTGQKGRVTVVCMGN